MRIISEATLEMVARLFYAQHNTRTPMFAYLGWLVVMVGLAYLLTPQLGIVALALASTISFTLLAAALFLLNRRALGSLDERFLAFSAGRAFLATAVMSLVVSLIGRVVTNPLLFLAAGGAAGVLSYLLLNLLLGGKEIPALIRIMRKREPV